MITTESTLAAQLKALEVFQADRHGLWARYAANVHDGKLPGVA